MRTGSWIEEPTLSQPFVFICDNGDCIRTQDVKRILADASGYTFVDWWDRDFFVERAVP